MVYNYEQNVVVTPNKTEKVLDYSSNMVIYIHSLSSHKAVELLRFSLSIIFLMHTLFFILKEEVAGYFAFHRIHHVVPATVMIDFIFYSYRGSRN